MKSSTPKGYYCSVSYDGSRFRGFQIQPDQSTVQGELQSALSQALREEILCESASRTDAGVHACDQRIWFQSNCGTPAKRMPVRLNRWLKHVRINWAYEVSPTFHWKDNDLQKCYLYRIRFGPYFPFHESYSLCLNDEELPQRRMEMQSILNLFEGEHDFELFSKHDRARVISNFRRTIFKIDLNESLEEQALIWSIHIHGSGFLWMMVRYIIAYALACLRQQVSKTTIRQMLCGQGYQRSDRPVMLAAPASGLYLYKTLGLPSCLTDSL